MSQKRKAILVVCLLVMGIAAGYLVYTFVGLKNTNRVYEQMKATAPTAVNMEETMPPTTAPTETPTTEPTTAPTEAPTEPKEPYVSPIDFDALHQRNPDIYAWIDIVGTDISYPLLQHPTEDNYYLDHTVDNVAGYPGSIYTQTIASKDFSSFNDVIYGHNMTTGTMFAPLERYRDEKFFDEHRTIMIYTPEATYTYTVYAAVLYNDWLINYLFDFTKEEDCMAFVESLDETRNLNNHIMTDMEITPEDHLITLSTCASGDHSHRYLIVAVRTNEEN